MSAIGGKADIPATEDQRIELVPEYPRSGTLTISPTPPQPLYELPESWKPIGEPDGLENAIADSLRANQGPGRPERRLLTLEGGSDAVTEG